MHLWAPEHLLALEKAQHWPEVVVIAHKELERLIPHGPVGQVCGPMTTGPRGFTTNMQIFRQVIALAEQEGMLIFNQIPLQQVIIRITKHHAGGDYRFDILTDLYAHIFGGGDLDFLLFIPGWEHSVGARWEHSFASGIELEMRNAPLRWVMRQEY